VTDVPAPEATEAPGLLDALRQAVGDAAVQVPTAQTPLDDHLVDWRGRYRGQALAVVKPACTAEVAEVIRLCRVHGVSIVPQGGNTSLVGGSVPDASGRQVVLNLQRMKRVLSVDAANLSMTVEAGCVLAEAQQAAAAHGLLFPLSLASEGSCTLGGVLATNAGGTQVLRYGTARELCLGLEVVTAQGEVWSGLKALRKDNTGYDLRNLMIGSEGTLGVITAASLRLHPRPRGTACTLLSCAQPTAALALLTRARNALDANLTACELMAPLPLALVREHLPDVTQALGSLALPNLASLPANAPWLVLLEGTSATSDAEAQARLEALAAQALEQGEVDGGWVAHNEAQRAAMWRLRESIPIAERLEGKMVKHDIGVPTSSVPVFIEAAQRLLCTRWPDSRVVCFGHLGDGNLHFNVQPPASVDSNAAFDAFEREVNAVVFDEVQRLGGTLSAEHGIGELRKHDLAQRQPAVALALMHSIKQALDPDGVLNPGRVLVSQGADPEVTTT